jgi:hypothetical protein
MLVFTLPDSDQPLRLRMRLSGFTYSPAVSFQPVEVIANDERVADWQVSDPADHIAIISPEVANHQQLFVELRMPQATSAKALGVGEDSRVLGVACYELEITETDDSALADAEGSGATPTLLGRQYTYGDVLTFGAAPGAHRFKVAGWYPAEKDYTWMGRDPGVLELRVPPTERPITLRMKLGGMVTPGALPMQPTELLVNSQYVTTWHVALPAEFSATIPPELIREDGTLRIELCAFNPASPKELGLGGDIRALSVRLESLVITPAPPATDAAAREKPPGWQDRATTPRATAAPAHQ